MRAINRTVHLVIMLALLTTSYVLVRAILEPYRIPDGILYVAYTDSEGGETVMRLSCHDMAVVCAQIYGANDNDCFTNEDAIRVRGDFAILGLDHRRTVRLQPSCPAYPFQADLMAVMAATDGSWDGGAAFDN